MGRMPERKPAGVRFETWIDRQIRQAEERGEFKDLPGAGAPLPGLGKPYDEMWWVKSKLRREGLSYLPPSLALRREVHDVVQGAARARTEAEVRDRIAAINEKIREAIRAGIRGPEVNLAPVNVERVVKEWRRARTRARGAESAKG
jgi:DnaJ homologue, subfamily C, member 28, conserved domain